MLTKAALSKKEGSGRRCGLCTTGAGSTTYGDGALAGDSASAAHTAAGSLVQAVARFVRATSDRSILEEEIDGVGVIERLDRREDRQQFVAHLCLEGSPFPASVDESEIYYHGGTTIAIAAEVLTHEEIAASLARMRHNVEASGAGTIGLTLYPPYPRGVFENPILTEPYTYQNGGDWTWFGGRTIQTLVDHGFVEDAYREVAPMAKRALENQGFWGWYTRDNRPAGWGSFRGSAGALGRAIEKLQEWATEVASADSDQALE